DGTAKFVGSTHTSYFNHMAAEYTYIRGGLQGSTIYINDIAGGKVIFGTGGTRIGFNTAYYQPPDYTLEIRQSNGGMELSNASYMSNAWEWRVVAGAPANFYLYYSNTQKAYFSNTNGALLQVSDGRLKNNIVPLHPVMEKLMQLEPVTYEMKNENPGHVRSIGFIAQNVQPLFPQLVSTNMPGEEDLLGLEYNGFGVLAIKGIQEEQQQIEQLMQNMNDAAARLKVLEQKLAAMKSRNKQP
ncbi:MAG TPA: tail fiber domain-containing protein, partial [Phnomibacter sp.]|nr:tail fiber domain-containing protein [Phnomibacter sp.]